MSRALRYAALGAVWAGIAFATAMILAPFAHAEPLTPDALIRGITEDVLSTIRGNPAIQAGDAQQIGEFVPRFSHYRSKPQFQTHFRKDQV